MVAQASLHPKRELRVDASRFGFLFIQEADNAEKTDRDQRAPSVQAARTVYCEQREGGRVSRKYSRSG